MDKKDTFIEILSSSTIKEKYTYTKKEERYYSECKGRLVLSPYSYRI